MEKSEAITIKSKNFRLLFDNGSQRSYIMDLLRIKFDLQTLKQERLNLNIFRSSGFRLQRCDVVKVYLQTSGISESVCVNVLSLPHL